MAAMRSVGVRLRLWSDQYKKDAAEAAQANRKLGESGHQAKRDLDGLAMGLGVVGAAMLAAAAAAVYATAKFDKVMSEVGAVSGATGEELRQLRDAALEAGAATAFSASQAAQAEAELAKAGISTADILGGALSGALSLASAGSLELAVAAEIAAAAMNTFGLTGADVGHIADVLAAAANKSAAGVEDLGLGLQQVGLVAAQVGFGLEETVALLAAFADRGLRGSDGATSLKTALLRLAAPLGEAQELMTLYGISLYDANGSMVDAVTIAGQLRSGLGNLSDAERNAALSTIFGADAIRAANVLYRLGADGVQEYVDAVNDQGAAADVAAQKLNNLAGDVEELTGSLETLFIQSGEGASSGLRWLVQGITALVNGFGELPKWVQQGGVLLLGIAGIAALTAAGFIKAYTAIQAANAALIAMGPAGAKAAIGLRAVSAALGGVTAGLAVLSVLEAFIDTTGGTTRQLTRAQVEQEEQAEQTRRSNVALAGSYGEAASAVDGLINKFRELNDDMLTQRSAMRDAEAAVDDLAEALDESNGSMDITTERGRAAEAALDALAEKAAIAAQETYDQTHSVEEANRVWQNYIDQLEQLLRQAGYSQEAIDDLIGSIARMPEYRTTTIDLQILQSTYGSDRHLRNMGMRAGGVMESAARGTVRNQARIATVPQVTWAEPETGGEAYIPRRGDYLRSMGILATAASWNDATVVPNSAWSSASGPSKVDVRVLVEAAPGADSAVLDLFRFSTTQTGNGDVQTHLGRRGRV